MKPGGDESDPEDIRMTEENLKSARQSLEVVRSTTEIELDRLRNEVKLQKQRADAAEQELKESFVLKNGGIPFEGMYDPDPKDLPRKDSVMSWCRVERPGNSAAANPQDKYGETPRDEVGDNCLR